MKGSIISCPKEILVYEDNRWGLTQIWNTSWFELNPFIYDNQPSQINIQIDLHHFFLFLKRESKLNVDGIPHVNRSHFINF